jgi:hypothetical protein
VTIKGERHSLWRAVEQGGHVRDIVVNVAKIRRRATLRHEARGRHRQETRERSIRGAYRTTCEEVLL